MKIVYGKWTVKGLQHTREMLIKYAHVYNNAMEKDRMPSTRIMNWVDYYENARNEAPEIWAQFCDKVNRDIDHNAGDLMA